MYQPVTRKQITANLRHMRKVEDAVSKYGRYHELVSTTEMKLHHMSRREYERFDDATVMRVASIVNGNLSIRILRGGLLLLVNTNARKEGWQVNHDSTQVNKEYRFARMSTPGSEILYGPAILVLPSLWR